MQITEVRIKLMDEPSERLKAFCSITFDDCFVIRDLKIIDGASGLFVAMPSRKLTARCPQCGCKNHLRAAYCNQCGLRLKDDRAIRDEHGRAKLYADIAHPINSRCREMVQQRIVEAFREEVEKAKLPGYVSSYDDFEHDLDFSEMEEPRVARAVAAADSEDAGRFSRNDQPQEPHPVGGPPAATSPVSSPAPPEISDADKPEFGAGIF